MVMVNVDVNPFSSYGDDAYAGMVMNIFPSWT